MPRDGLVGSAVELVVNEPWDLTNVDGSVRFHGTVARSLTYREGAEEERVLVELADAVHWHDRTYRYFVVRHRRGEGFVEELVRGRPAECNYIAISDQQAASDDPFDTSWWRGGLAGGVTVVSPG